MAGPGWAALAAALAANDVSAWQAAVTRTRELEALAPRVARQAELRDRLAAVAPLWTTEIVSDVDSAGAVHNLKSAWQWRQLETWVRAVAARPSPAVLRAELEAVGFQRRRAVTELVTERAWRRLVDNLGHPQRQALEEYVQASKRFGKTGGKHASRWIAEMRRAMGNATTAVPVWIMPTSRALLNFRPAATPPFDVLIIDEASQIGITALPLLALAKSTIVVGDDQQTSPENVGLDREPVYRLMDDHLREIPGYKTVFDPDKSLYDLALLRFSQPIMLTEHFRCLPQIIEFSNQLSYNGRIVPLRDRPPHPGWRAVRTVRVPDGYRRGFENPPEAEAVVALLRDLDADPAYAGKTFGVISLLGTAQTKLISTLLYDTLGPALVERRQIRVGEPASFQGDERDVMVISTVVADDPSKDRTRIGAMTREADKRRINVAASRARDQMWLVTSVETSVFSPGDFRAALLTHCSEAGVGDDERGDLLDRCESEFERRVVRKLLARGYVDVAVQHRVGQYRLDIVVSGPDARLAVECDGDRWHTEAEWDRDRARQDVLERAGWTFERIRGSSFYRDPDTAMQPVWERLGALGIPVGEWRPAAVISSVGAAADAGAGAGTEGIEPTPVEDAPNPVEVPAPRVEPESVAVTERAGGSDQAPADGHPVGGSSAAVEAAIETDTEAAMEQAPAWTPPAWYRPAREEPLPVADGPGQASTSTRAFDGPPAWYRPPVDEVEPVTAEAQPEPAPPTIVGPPAWYRPPVDDSPQVSADPQPAPEAPAPAGPPAWYAAILAERGRDESAAPTVQEAEAATEELKVDGALPELELAAEIAAKGPTATMAPDLGGNAATGVGLTGKVRREEWLTAAENHYEPRFRSVTFAIQVDIDPEDARRTTQALGHEYDRIVRHYREAGYSASQVEQQGHRFLRSRPASLVAAMVGTAAFRYTENGYWPGFFDDAGLPLTVESERVFGTEFLAALSRLGLPTFGHLDLRFVGPILMHAAIPGACLQDLARLLIDRRSADPGLDGRAFLLWALDPVGTGRLASVDAPVRHFLRDGGDYARELIDRILELLDLLQDNPANTAAVDVTPAGTGLPRAVITALLDGVRAGFDRARDAERPLVRGQAVPVLEYDHSNGTIVLNLPEVWSEDGTTSWSIDSAGTTVEVESESDWFETHRAPATSVDITTPTTVISVANATSDVRTQIALGTGGDPAVYFDHQGRFLPPGRALPAGMCWAVMPSDRFLIDKDSRPIDICWNDGEPLGWVGWSAVQVDLSEVIEVRCAGADDVGRGRSVQRKEMPTIELGQPIVGVTTGRGDVVYAHRPVIHLPSGSGVSTDWTIGVSRLGVASKPELSKKTTVDESLEVDPFETFSGKVVGTFALTVNGPEGRNAKDTVTLNAA